jgi:hypothetical protein
MCGLGPLKPFFVALAVAARREFRTTPAPVERRDAASSQAWMAMSDGSVRGGPASLQPATTRSAHPEVRVLTCTTQWTDAAGRVAAAAVPRGTWRSPSCRLGWGAACAIGLSMGGASNRCSTWNASPRWFRFGHQVTTRCARRAPQRPTTPGRSAPRQRQRTRPGPHLGIASRSAVPTMTCLIVVARKPTGNAIGGQDVGARLRRQGRSAERDGVPRRTHPAPWLATNRGLPFWRVGDSSSPGEPIGLRAPLADDPDSPLSPQARCASSVRSLVPGGGADGRAATGHHTWRSAPPTCSSCGDTQEGRDALFHVEHTTRPRSARTDACWVRLRHAGAADRQHRTSRTHHDFLRGDAHRGVPLWSLVVGDAGGGR